MTIDAAVWLFAFAAHTVTAYMYLSGRWTDARWAWICGGFFMLCVVKMVALLTTTP